MFDADPPFRPVHRRDGYLALEDMVQNHLLQLRSSWRWGRRSASANAMSTSGGRSFEK